MNIFSLDDVVYCIFLQTKFGEIINIRRPTTIADNCRNTEKNTFEGDIYKLWKVKEACWRYQWERRRRKKNTERDSNNFTFLSQMSSIITCFLSNRTRYHVNAFKIEETTDLFSENSCSSSHISFCVKDTKSDLNLWNFSTTRQFYILLINHNSSLAHLIL